MSTSWNGNLHLPNIHKQIKLYFQKSALMRDKSWSFSGIKTDQNAVDTIKYQKVKRTEYFQKLLLKT